MLLKFVFMASHYQSAETEAGSGVVCVPSEEAVSLGSGTSFSALPGVLHGAQRNPGGRNGLIVDSYIFSMLLTHLCHVY